MSITINREELMEKVVALCKRRGFIFQSGEIYGGLSGFYDYGPYGVALKRNIRNLWWRHMVELRDDVVGLSRRSSCIRRSGWPRAMSASLPTRSSNASGAVASAGGPTMSWRVAARNVGESSRSRGAST